MKNVLKIFYVLIVFLLLGGCIYFYNESKKPNLDVRICTPVSENRINCGEVITDKDVVNEVLIGLAHATSIHKPEITEKLPDATLDVGEYEIGIIYLSFNIWFEDERVIFESGHEQFNNVEYKEVVGAWGETFKEYILKYR